MGASSHDDAPCQLFEIAGPGGVAMMVEAMGQDRKQLVPSIRYWHAVISHRKAKPRTTTTRPSRRRARWLGCLTRKALLVGCGSVAGNLPEVPRSAVAGDIEELAIEVGAEDVQQVGDAIVVCCGSFFCGLAADIAAAL